MNVEDWFKNLCPAVKPIDYSTLPSCARDCISNNAFDYGCITSDATCFCSHNSVFGCEKKCKNTKDVDAILNWYTAQCHAPMASASNALNSAPIETDKAGAPSPPIKKRKLRWYEVMAIIVFVATAIALVVGVILIWMFDPESIKEKIKTS